MSIHIMIEIASEGLKFSTETYNFLTQSQKVHNMLKSNFNFKCKKDCNLEPLYFLKRFEKNKNKQIEIPTVFLSINNPGEKW